MQRKCRVEHIARFTAGIARCAGGNGDRVARHGLELVAVDADDAALITEDTTCLADVLGNDAVVFALEGGIVARDHQVVVAGGVAADANVIGVIDAIVRRAEIPDRPGGIAGVGATGGEPVAGYVVQFELRLVRVFAGQYQAGDIVARHAEAVPVLRYGTFTAARRKGHRVQLHAGFVAGNHGLVDHVDNHQGCRGIGVADAEETAGKRVEVAVVRGLVHVEQIGRDASRGIDLIELATAINKIQVVVAIEGQAMGPGADAGIAHHHALTRDRVDCNQVFAILIPGEQITGGITGQVNQGSHSRAAADGRARPGGQVDLNQIAGRIRILRGNRAIEVAAGRDVFESVHGISDRTDAAYHRASRRVEFH